MRLESMKPTTDREREIRRKAHAQAILYGMTMRDAVYKALEMWVNKKNETMESSRVQRS
jgi:hypothetical protein